MAVDGRTSLELLFAKALNGHRRTLITSESGCARASAGLSWAADRMRICRYLDAQGQVRVGFLEENDTIRDLTTAGIERIEPLLESDTGLAELRCLAKRDLPSLPLAIENLLAPIEEQEVWAAGVTYLRSKAARMEESDFSATAYDRVYEAPRPELFFKSLPRKVVPPGDPVGIRRDARWSVPEPELALVINSRGKVVGYTIGNDMSSRDIEGENLLYLPQAKIYERSCAIGPCIRVAADETEARGWGIHLAIHRSGAMMFQGDTRVGQIKRRFDELAEYLFRCQQFPHGAVLLTGTGIVPPDNFTLQPGDTVTIRIDGIGTLENGVIQV
jgi:2-dehydro-3-deoxy-D-arabinonate dehydratase